MNPENVKAWLLRVTGFLSILAKLTPTTVDDNILAGLQVLATSDDFIAILTGLLELVYKNPTADVSKALVELMKTRSMLPK